MRRRKERSVLYLIRVFDWFSINLWIWIAIVAAHWRNTQVLNMEVYGTYALSP